jgi:predicted nucleic acid-binding protein
MSIHSQITPGADLMKLSLDLCHGTDVASLPVVLDTSAVLAVLTHGPHRSTLIQLTREAELLAPSSLPAELGNALSAMLKRGRVSLGSAKVAVETFREIPIHLSQIDLGWSLELSHALGLHAYDTYPLVCCLRHQAALLTLNDEQRAAAERAGVEVLEVDL